MAVSNKAWSSFQKSDYSDAQYKRAALICEGSGTPKETCHLPVREPDGTLNRNGVRAAAAALAGARGGVKVSPAAKRQAAKKLLALYKESGDTPPPSLYRIAGVNAPTGK